MQPHPLQSLLLLMGLVFAGALLGGMVSLLLGMLLTGVSDWNVIGGVLTGDPEHLTLFRIVQGGSSFAMFALPPLLLGRIEGNAGKYFQLNSKSLTFPLFACTLLIVLASGPVSELLARLNSQLVLPQSLTGLEEWMKSKEEQAGAMTLTLLRDTSFSGFMGNILVMALIAAVGEEMLFRGALQRIFARWFGSGHAAILFTAMIFSAIHLQFYGFLPRMFLGLLFGYLYWWSGNMWLPILAHFVNNASVLVIAYATQIQGQALDTLEYGYEVPAVAYLVSLLLVVSGIYYFRKWSHRPSIEYMP